MTDPDDDDLIAGEYVLGTLDGTERTAAALRQRDDAAFAGLIAGWDRRLTALSEASREMEPPAHVWAGILKQLGFDADRVPSEQVLGRTVVMLSRSVQRWKRATVVATALAACLVVVVAAGAWRDAVAPAPTFVALLQKTDAAPAAYVMRANLSDRTLAVHALDTRAPPGRSYELWVIDPSIGPPKSLGVLDAATSLHALPPGTSPNVLADATYAVTEEQAGGSPSGAPTGAPVYVGHLVSSRF